MACRDLGPASTAKTKLIKFLDEHINQLKKKPGYDGRADVFRRNLQIDIHHIDLASVEATFKFVDTVTDK
jgi:3-keto steroid reductase